MTPLVAILGAGRAQRFGADKLNQPCCGKPLGQWPLDVALASGLDTVWITGDRPPPWLGTQCRWVANPQAGAGLSTSVSLAVELAVCAGHDAVLILLADMPRVTGAMVSALLDTATTSAFRHPGDRPGVPALIEQRHFPAMAALSGDRGAGALLASIPGLVLLDAPQGALFDVDTPAALAAASSAMACDQPGPSGI